MHHHGCARKENVENDATMDNGGEKPNPHVGLTGHTQHLKALWCNKPMEVGIPQTNGSGNSTNQIYCRPHSRHHVALYDIKGGQGQ